MVVLATRGILAWLRHRAILDHPNERSSHTMPTPRGGGLAVVPVVLLVWTALALMNRLPPGGWVALAAALLLMGLSWLDDRGGLPAGLRLAGHFAGAIAGMVAMPAGALVFQGLLPPLADHVLAVLAWVWFVNLYNFMDGIDGITGTETAAIGLGLALVAAMTGGDGAGLFAPALVLAAAGAGFLVWNWHPARIFLGDAGSVPLGYLGGWLLLTLAARGLWAPALIIPGYYVADATITLVRRASRGEKVWEAHREHYYQIALRAGASHATVVRAIAVADIVLIAFAWLALLHPWLALAGAAVLVAGLLRWLKYLGVNGKGGGVGA